MLSRSTKSVRSIHSIESGSGDVELDEEADRSGLPSKIFEEVLPYICKKFRCTFDVVVRKGYLQEPKNRYKVMETPIKRKKVGVINATPYGQYKKKDDNDDHGSQANESVVIPFQDPNLIPITSLYDNNKQLVELLFYKLDRIPRRLIQAIGLIAPLYELLTKISVRRSLMDGYTVYELNKIMSTVAITEMSFDDSFLAEGNYAVLLESASSLRYLSLNRCQINDVVVETIVTRLHFLKPAEKNLSILNMSSNFITDVGAKYISEMLRSNRNLRYLNLAGNSITDKGVGHILDSLIDFQLNLEELCDKRRRIINYLRSKREIADKLLSQYNLSLSIDGSYESGVGSPSGNRLSYESGKKERIINQRLKMVDALAIQMLGQLYDPYGPGKTFVKGGLSYCKGNLTLSYLNLSYNYLTQFSVTRVLNMLLYQKEVSNETEKGLQIIKLEGNALPENCLEITKIFEIINEKLLPYGKRKSAKSEKSEMQRRATQAK